MARRFADTIDNWARGAITNSYPDKLPKEASPRALNAAWLRTGYPAKRKGTSILTQSGPSGKPAILAMGTFNTMQWAIFDNGHWMKLVSGAWVDIDAGNPIPFSSGPTNIPITAIANNLLFAVNGADQKKTDGTTVMKYGIAAPATPSAVVGAAGNPNGTYRVALSALNHNTGAESSRSTNYAEVAVVNQRITASWTFPSDTQVTDIIVHIFKVGLTDRFFRLVGANVTPAANSFGGYDSGTISISINVTDADINNLIIESPDIHQNDPPPTNTTFIAFHGARMFLTDGTSLFFTDVNKPESFNPDHNEPVSPGNGQKIIGFASLSDDLLVIGKELSFNKLIGPSDPNTWEIRDLDNSIGLKAPRSIVAAEGSLFWHATQGIMQMEVGGQPHRIAGGGADQEPAFEEQQQFNEAQLDKAISQFDSINRRVLFAVPSAGQSRVDTILPYNLKLKVWEDKWDPMDVSGMGTFIDSSTKVPYVVLGGYKGRAFRLWTTPYVDGVRMDDGAGNPFTLKGHPTLTGVNTLEDEAANFDISGDGLQEIPILAVSPDNLVVRNIILSNTKTVITLNSNWSQQPDKAWTYYIGCPNYELDIKTLSPTSNPVSSGSKFNTRTFKHIQLKGLSDTGGAHIQILANIDQSDASNVTKAASVFADITGSGGVWNIDLWNIGVWGGEPTADTKHVGLGKRGKTCGLRIINRDPTVGFVLLGIGLMGTEHGYKD